MSETCISILGTQPTPGELDDLFGLACQLYGPSLLRPEHDVNVSAIVDSPDRCLYVARTDRICGQLVLQTIVETGMRYGLIGGVVVDESMRGRGVAGSLIDAAVGYAHQLGISRFDLTSSNPRAQSVYAGYGFEPYDTQVMRLCV